jgi:hypothetical protein
MGTGAITIGLVLGLALGLGLATGDAGASKSSTKTALAHAKKQLLKLSDMPKGWVSSKSSDGGSSFPGQNELASCIGVPASTIKLNPPSSNSPEFGNKDETETVDDSISIFTSSKVAKSQYAAMANSKTPGCFAQILNGPSKKQLSSNFGAGATVGTISVSRPSAPRSFTGFTLTFNVVDQGQSIPVRLTEIVAIKGTEGLQLGFTAVENPFPSSLYKHLTSVALARL